MESMLAKVVYPPVIATNMIGGHKGFFIENGNSGPQILLKLEQSEEDLILLGVFGIAYLAMLLIIIYRYF